MKRMVLKTPAKINLALDVTGTKPDGYHLLETVFQTISLYDTVTVNLKPGQGMRLTCNIPWVPKDERNIAWKAVDLFQKATGIPVNAEIHLQKYIPSQAGLGGGSSDAAAVLYALHQLTGAGLTQQQLCELGLQLGADVPFFFHGGTAYAEGVGELLTPLPYIGEYHVVIAKERNGVSTAAAYQAIDKLESPKHPPIAKLRASLEKEQRIAQWKDYCQNLFTEAVSLESVNELKRRMKAMGACCAEMTGSGSAVFAMFASQEAAHRCCVNLRRTTEFVTRCKTIPCSFFPLVN